MTPLTDAMAYKMTARFGGQMMAIREEDLVAHVHKAASFGFLIGSEAAAIPVEISDGIATVTIDGVMMPTAEWHDEVSTKELSDVFDGLAADPNVRGVVMLINSPGGAVAGHADLMESATALAQAKPLMAQVSGICCSAGYWLATAAAAIYANAGDVIGSVGVRNHIYDLSKMFEDMGVRTVDISTGPHKSTGLPGAPVTAEQEAKMRIQVDFVYGNFAAAVMKSRGMSRATFDTIGTGEVWYGSQAIELGLVDVLQKHSATHAELISALTFPSKKELAMSQETPAEGPKVVTTAELKKQFPKSTAEWREEQTESAATLAEAAVAYAQFQEEQAEAARTELAEAKAKAEKAAAAPPPKPARGVKAAGNVVTEEDADDEQDYRELAKAYQMQHACRWSEATLAIKKKYGEDAIAFFNGPPARTRQSFQTNS